MRKARDGAAHIAAGLTLGQSFTLRAPAQEPDPELAAGALDANKLLADWTDGEGATLLRRGIFTPATYGRIRFHQRSTQEFLTAQWFHSQLEQGCPKEVVFQILFNDIYGVKTIVPSVRPAAAWLALWHDDVRGEILNRDPLMLIQYGDPGSLPLETRRELLHAYARMDKAGDIADDTL
ncbi:MAG: hypothetical protein IH933_07905, partial [Euryarchaeota archaeon]|nr:hypothetical protein [Euryarchaeota archaeon]